MKSLTELLSDYAGETVEKVEKSEERGFFHFFQCIWRWFF
jgi:hypothetical protein